MLKIFSALAGAMLGLAAVTAALPALAQSTADLGGVWRNPKNSVHVEVRPCGPSMCGYVVWASEKARRDAREGGTPELIGQQLFRDFNQDKGGTWKGRVFVPDIGKTFSGSAERLDAHSLKAKGCVLGLICKTQIWTRVEG